MSNPVVIELPLPPECLHPNARPHWRQKAAAVKQARALANLLARQVYSGPPMAAACYRLVFRLPRKRDYDGLLSWCKSYLDGLQSVVVANDSELRPIGIERFSGKAETGGSYGVKIVIWLEASDCDDETPKLSTGTK